MLLLNSEKYNVLLDNAPTHWGGVEINTDFHAVLEFFRIIDTPEERKSNEVKATEIISVFFKEPPKFDNENIWEFFEEYISCGQKVEEKERDKVFDWGYDSNLIYAAFLQAYRIDLRRSSMHWWEFKSLFDALPEGSRLFEVIRIRGQKMPEGKTKEAAKERYKLMRLKEKFAIKK